MSQKYINISLLGGNHTGKKAFVKLLQNQDSFFSIIDAKNREEAHY